MHSKSFSIIVFKTMRNSLWNYLKKKRGIELNFWTLTGQKQRNFTSCPHRPSRLTQFLSPSRLSVNSELCFDDHQPKGFGPTWFTCSEIKHTQASTGLLHWPDGLSSVSGCSPLTSFLTEANLMVRPCSVALIYYVCSMCVQPYMRE